ncbi:MAG: hypothetical protein CMM93_07600, partial [Rickettsiales bacterium]|nr:hypothetical protein [Rickettsiales bacterium]
LPHEAVQPLIRHWVQMIGEHPESYLAHRWRVTCYLLDLCHDPDQPGIITHPFPVEAYQGHWYEGPTAEALNIHIDSPREAAIDTSLAIRWLRFHTVLMSPWVYMLGLLSLLPLLWRKRGTRYGALGLTINTSAWLMALPLFFIVPNLQVRYLIWPICASILCLICYAASRQQE